MRADACAKRPASPRANGADGAPLPRSQATTAASSSTLTAASSGRSDEPRATNAPCTALVPSWQVVQSASTTRSLP